MASEVLWEVLGTPLRAKIVATIEERPMGLYELAEALDTTPQAVLKHLRRLERFGLVEGTEVSGLVRRVYRLKVPFHLEFESTGDWTGLHAYFGQMTRGEERVSSVSMRLLEDLEVERALLQRRLKALKTREGMLRTLLQRLIETEKNALRTAGFDEREGAAILEYIRGEGELAEICRQFHIDPDRVTKVLQRLVSK